MKMVPTLCIVDVQPYFEAADHVIKSVVNQIHAHRRLGSQIILVEFDPANLGHSAEEVLVALSDYGKAHRVTKYGDDGSFVVLRLAEEKKISLKHVNICGVNTCCCVRETGVGLVEEGSNVTLIKEASWCSIDIGQWVGDHSCFEHDPHICLRDIAADFREVKLVKQRNMYEGILAR
jgi:nicotinamidase-related amidase